MAGEAQLVGDLLAIPGVADADVAPDSPEGVKVTLAYGADATGVAAAVRDVLARHGLRSRMAPPQSGLVPEEAPPPPPPPSNVLPGPGLIQTTIVPPPSEQPIPVRLPAESPPEEVMAAEAMAAETMAAETMAAETMATETAAVEAHRAAPEPEPAAPVASAAAGESHLEAVRVEERRDGVSVTVQTRDGHTVTKPGRASDAGVFEAVVAAVGEASGAAPAPVLVEVGESDLGGRSVVTVVLQRPDGSMLVGSSLVGAEKAFAVARATWAAIAEAD